MVHGGRSHTGLASLIHGTLASKFASSDGGAAMAARQTLKRPLYTPVSMTPEMPDEMLDVVALYAGECVRHISALKPASEIVEELA